MNNRKEFEELIERYESITAEEVNAISVSKEDDFGFEIASNLTGYGRRQSCTLCVAVDDVCTACTWYVYKPKAKFNGYPCVSRTYNAIEDSKTTEEILIAFKNRAKYMKKHLKQLKKLDI